MDIIRIIAAFLLPPLGVFLQERFSKRFWIDVVLTLIGYVPGIIYAVYVILKYEPVRVSRVGPPGRTRQPPGGRNDRAPPPT